ncbi:hypothetical protein [Sphingobacterium sp. DR205]|uniref:hypothetical protein n=1 Tax=Sphingobacterium sp. DR205 TaxID=2713573 RepID=UPI0013E47A7E|nr:hypothetical protein [Sphingobacterium sp. DR205]QIH34061.1 hypothetical protein G6053_14730 [Sphingobacterium sp. DR205]
MHWFCPWRAVYIGGALKDADVSLSITYKVVAIGLLVAALSLLLVKVKNNTNKIK